VKLNQGFVKTVNPPVFPDTQNNEMNRKRSEKEKSITRAKISLSLTGRSPRKQSREEIIKRRLQKSGNIVQNELYYNIKTHTFIMMDKLDATSDHIKVFTSIDGYRLIFDINGNKKCCHPLSPTPQGFYDEDPKNQFIVFNKISKELRRTTIVDLSENDIRISVSNGYRVKVKFIPENRNIYLQKYFISIYGLPSNCEYFKNT
jgi:hypothetical protein